MTSEPTTLPLGRVTRSASWFVYAVLFLILGTYSGDRSYELLMAHLAATGQVGRWNWWVDWSATAFLLLVLLQMVLILVWHRVRFGESPIASLRKEVRFAPARSLFLGVLIGLVLALGSIPILRFHDVGVSVVSSLIDDFYSARAVVLVMLLAAALPVTTELVFRGALYKRLYESASAPAALLASSLVFAYVVPLFHPLVIFLLGVANGVLYHRTGKLFPGVLASATFSVCCTVALMWYTLQGS